MDIFFQKLSSEKSAVLSSYPKYGVSIGIQIKDSTYTFNYGYRTHNARQKIDEHTLFEDGTASYYIEANAVTPADGAKSSVVDLLKYINAQLYPPHTELGRAIQKSQSELFSSKEKKLVYGWEVIGDGIFKTDGDTFGNSSVIRFDTKHKIGIVILSNYQNAELVAELEEKIYDYIKKNYTE